MTVQEVAKKYADYQIGMRRFFHAHPEVSTKEFNTSAKIKEELDKIGVPWRPCGLETGILATIKGAKPGRTILLRGDIDALTVNEETGYDFASQDEGVMHACGHDCHISMLLTAAHILNDMKDELAGTVKLAFQPAEEVALGAKSMIEQGALDGVDGCFGIHVWSDIPAGQVSVKGGPRMASGDQFNIDVIGKGGHGATPHLCVDAAVVTAAILNNIQTIVSREISPIEPAVITVGTMQAGTRWNVIAETGRLEGTARCFSRELRLEIPKMLTRVAEETAKTYRATAKVEYNFCVPPTINDPAMAALVFEAAKKVVAPDPSSDYGQTLGGEDFAFYLEKCPGAIALLGVGNEACNAVYPQHSPHYRVDEDMLLKGAMLYAQTAVDFLNK